MSVEPVTKCMSLKVVRGTIGLSYLLILGEVRRQEFKDWGADKEGLFLSRGTPLTQDLRCWTSLSQKRYPPGGHGSHQIKGPFGP